MDPVDIDRLARAAPSGDPSRLAMRREWRERFRESLEELGEPCRSLIVAYYCGSRRDLESARKVIGHLSRKALYQRIWRCRMEFRRILERRGVWRVRDGA